MFNSNYYVYIMSNYTNSVLYTGVTNDIERRVWEHKDKVNPKCFTSIYNVNKLLYVEHFTSISDAIAFEKRIKAGSRAKKEALINAENLEWIDLTTTWTAEE